MSDGFINIDDNIELINNTQLKKMIFINNALEHGWCVKKRKNIYVFYKKHQGSSEIYSETYINEFINLCLAKPL